MNDRVNGFEQLWRGVSPQDRQKGGDEPVPDDKTQGSRRSQPPPEGQVTDAFWGMLQDAIGIGMDHIGWYMFHFHRSWRFWKCIQSAIFPAACTARKGGVRDCERHHAYPKIMTLTG